MSKIKKEIKTVDGVTLFDLDEALRQFDGMAKDFAHRCVREISSYQDNIYTFDDYYQQGLLEITKVFEKYDLEKGACFSTLLFKELNHRMIMNIRKLTSKKRNCERKKLFLDDIQNDMDNTSLVEGKVDVYFQDETCDLEQFILKKTTEEERLMISTHFSSRSKMESGKQKQYLNYASLIFLDNGLKECLTKTQLANKLKVSRPTLDKKIQKVIEKVINLTKEYKKLELTNC